MYNMEYFKYCINTSVSNKLRGCYFYPRQKYTIAWREWRLVQACLLRAYELTSLRNPSVRALRAPAENDDFDEFPQRAVYMSPFRK